ncbi:4Fe-4S binding protein [Limibaculum sp. M0105]|uniref:4Fe-4S binding protein n=1 Tax=Thermohalobaculum xanthum TaxID=2753746 RepID=A0A8J7SFC8_9RHOB|nr:NosR/NirI family protein [Thermohalobaculum xanthum]MBK0399462.1 4Fe-4S binding protein [Thermohalobaculum xanthum]
MRLRHAVGGICLAAGLLGGAPGPDPVAAAPAQAAGAPFGTEAVEPAEPTPAIAARLFSQDGAVSVVRSRGTVPAWRVTADGRVLGDIGSTYEIAGSVGYSGRPLDVLVAVTADGRIAGAELMQHNEPILTLGISTEDIAAYVGAFRGYDLTRPALERSGGTAAAQGEGLPDVISRATVTTGVIRDAILRTARTLAAARGVAGEGGGIDRQSLEPRDWAALLAEGGLATASADLAQARAALAGAKVPLPDGEGVFLELFAGVIDPPTVGENLLGAPPFSRAMAMMRPGDSALLVGSAGMQSHRGAAWRQTGQFERVTVVQGDTRFQPTEADFLRIDKLAIAGAPELREISVFRLPGEEIDPTHPFRVEVTATRPTDAGEATMTVGLDYAMPAAYRLAPPQVEAEAPLWVSAWQKKRASVIGVGAMLAVLGAILFLQESFVRRPRLWRWGRIGFLSVTLVWLGWIAGGQLSVVQVVAFLHSLLTGFRWETFLIEPVIFMLWGFVGLGLLFWGRGVYCGWLCPFGALQEITNEIAQRLKVPQIEVPFAVQERLWVIKYTLFIAILALSFYSMEQALVLAEVEPFKTAMSMRFMRAWPFVAFVVALLVAGLFIERFYCRYLCPLGAALAIPAKLKLFDWLHRRPQCGRECRLCEQQCTVGAIDPIGRINPNECVLCLRCQMIYHDPATCTVLKRRAARG